MAPHTLPDVQYDHSAPEPNIQADVDARFAGDRMRAAIVRRGDAVKHREGDATFEALVSPSKNSTQLSAWRIELGPGANGRPHSVDREEIVLVVEGRLRVDLDGTRADLGAGDGFLAAPGSRFSLSNPTERSAIAWSTAIVATYDDGSRNIRTRSSRGIPSRWRPSPPRPREPARTTTSASLASTAATSPDPRAGQGLVLERDP
jgi:quercetin dioxygenase-like cupin family protein